MHPVVGHLFVSLAYFFELLGRLTRGLRRRVVAYSLRPLVFRGETKENGSVERGNFCASQKSSLGGWPVGVAEFYYNITTICLKLRKHINLTRQTSDCCATDQRKSLQLRTSDVLDPTSAVLIGQKHSRRRGHRSDDRQEPQPWSRLVEVRGRDLGPESLRPPPRGPSSAQNSVT